jgi:rhamnogalacturonan acetylesterase
MSDSRSVARGLLPTERLGFGPRAVKVGRLFLAATAIASCAPAIAAEPAAPAHDSLPTLYLVGDSTVNNSTSGLQGWGTPLAGLFDRTKIHVENRARGGRSSRSYFREGLWDQVAARLGPGDFVLIQFGHNDGGGLGKSDRASIKGTGDELHEVVDPKTGMKETVHTYGWYLRRYVADTKAKGATPIVLSPVPRNIWKDGKVARASADYGKWATDVARDAAVPFIDLNDLIARQYEQVGQERVAAKYFTTADHTHTTTDGAAVSAKCVAAGIRQLKDVTLARCLVVE